MTPISEFSFLCRDGLHYYWYNRNAQISIFKLINRGSKEVVYQKEFFCACEDYHIRRIQKDFNSNCIDVPNDYTYLIKLIKQKTRSLFFDLCCCFLFLILFSLSGFFWSAVRTVEVFYDIKKRKFTKQKHTDSTKSSF